MSKAKRLTTQEAEQLPRVRVTVKQKEQIVRLLNKAQIRDPKTKQYEISVRVVELGLKAVKEQGL